MFLVICYAVHEKKLAGVYQFHSQDEAFACMEMDVKNTYDEEIANSGNLIDTKGEKRAVKSFFLLSFFSSLIFKL